MKNLFITLLIIFTFFSCQSQEEKIQYQKSLANTKKGVRSWIENHALYPNSYIPISYSDFSQSFASKNDNKIPNSENYVIKHTHKILNKDSQIVIFSGYFILENDLDVSLIEIKRSNTIGGTFPPKIEIWMDNFGRELNSKDSINLKQNEVELKEKIEKTIEEQKIKLSNSIN